MVELELHPLCTLFPRMSGKEFENLKLDIKENGQREPIIIHDGLILDGGNRYHACIELEIEPQTMRFCGGNLASYVLSANLHRRHLSTGQQAAIVACVQDWSQAQSAGRPKCGNVAGLGDKIPEKQKVAERAAISGASERTQRSADKVAKASPKLAKQVARGEISLPQAEKKLNQKPSAPVKKQEPLEETPPQYAGAIGPSREEIESALAAEAEQIDYIRKLLESDDPLAQALRDVKKFKAAARIAEERFTGLQNEKNALIRQVKSLQAKLLKATAK